MSSIFWAFAVWTLTGMACGAPALAALLLPHAALTRSAARSAPGKIGNDVLAKNRDMIVALNENSSVYGKWTPREPGVTARLDGRDPVPPPLLLVGLPMANARQTSRTLAATTRPQQS